MSFSNIPVRANGTTILASWYNLIRTYLITAFGTEHLLPSSFSGLASQTGTDVTSLVFDSTTTRRADVSYVIVTATKVESGDFILLYDGSTWVKYDGGVQGVDSLVTMAVNSSTGQVEYDSGIETFTLSYKATTFNI